MKTTIKKGQIWQQKGHSLQVEVIRRKDFRWQCRILTDRTGVYAGTHTMTPYTLWSKYELIMDT